jgi:putative hemolysin
MNEQVERLDFASADTAQEDFSFSYSRPEFSWSRRLLIRSIEKVTGQHMLEQMYREWSANPSTGENIFAAAIRLLRIDLHTDFSAWRQLPKEGPLLVIANHPYGVLDGLSIGYLTTLVRPDVKIMTHSLLCQPKEVQGYMLPVDFGGTPEAQLTSLMTRRRAMEWLKDGHVVVVFPAGGVSTSQSPLRGHAIDNAWHPFIAKLARLPGVNIVPVFFHGQNSRLFQIATHVSYPLRLALLFHESVRKIGGKIKVSLGETVASSSLENTTDRVTFMKQLRSLVYGLAGADGPDGSQEFIWPKHIRFD